MQINYTAEIDFRLGPGTRGCPGEDYLHQEVARQLGYDPLVADPHREPIGRFAVVLSRSPRGLTAKIDYVKLDGTLAWSRPADNYDFCKDLIKGVAFAIATELTVQAAEAPEPAPASPPPAPRMPPPPTPDLPVPPPAQTAPPPVPAPPSPSALRVRVEVGAALLGSFGMEPSPTAGGALHLGVVLLPRASTPLSFSLALEGRADAPVGGAANQLRTGLLAVSALACVHVDASVWSGRLGYPFACVVGMRGTLRTTSESTVGGSASVGRAYAGLGGRFGFQAHLAPFISLLAQAELRGAARGAYVATGSGRAGWSTPSVSGELGIGALFSFDLAGR
ncbi:MAG: hypothetical protein QM820_04500 [Minicystis sp.]